MEAPVQNADQSILAENIRDLKMRKELIEEQTDISLALLADMIASASSSVKNDGAQEYSEIIKNHARDLDAKEHISFLSALIDRVGTARIFFERDAGLEIFSQDTPARISYVKNKFNDTAFMRFSTLFKLPKVVYGSTFEDICEDVYNAASDYCILPIENAANGKLFSFYSLIDKYDLKIFAVCDLDEGLAGKRTRFALLSRKKLIHFDSKISSYFEFSIVGDDSYSLSEIVEAASASALKLYRVDTLPLPYDDMSFRFYHVFEGTRADALPFLIYLKHKYPSHQALGQYIYLK